MHVPVFRGTPGCGSWASQITPPAPFPNFLKARAQYLGPHGRSRGRPPPGKLDPRTCRAAGSRAPFVPHNPLPPLPPPFQPPGFKVKFGGPRGVGCHLSVPFTGCSLPWGLLVPLEYMPSSWSFPKLSILCPGWVCVILWQGPVCCFPKE